MRGYVNPLEFLESQRKKVEDEKAKKKHFPERAQRDVLLFLLEHAPLEAWEFDVLAILREEAYYFAPQGQTKIMNEGWASYWHSTIMTRKALTSDEIIDYADHHSGTLGTRPGALNPYKLGIELYRDIEERWNKGRFGKEWDECDDLKARRAWDKNLGLGREKIFEVRKHYNDVTFIDTFLTAEFAMEQKLFVYGFNEKRNSWEILDREFRKVKNKLLSQLTNFGQPIIEVVDGNFENRGELLLAHKHDGQDLKPGLRARDAPEPPDHLAPALQPRHQGRGEGRVPAFRRSEPDREEGGALSPSPTLSSAEVLVLRLTVTPGALAQAVEDANLPGLRLSSHDGAEVTFGLSRLVFRAVAEGLEAESLVVRDDPQATFTLRLLAPLFQRHRGDLVLLLSWDGEAEPRELRIVEGKATSAPGTGSQRGSSGLGTAEEKEIRRLLDEARRHWEEYQRLKAGAGKADTP
jgi:hypothetical protein